MTRLEQLAEEWAAREYGPTLIDGQRNWSRTETQDAYLAGLRAGIEMSLERMDRVIEGYYERHEHQHENGVRGAQHFIRESLLEQHRAPQPPPEDQL